jgi:hypothetical protein
MRLILLTFVLAHFNSFGQGTPILMINEQDYRYEFNPTIVVYSDGTVIKNLNEPHEVTEYFITKFDTADFANFLTKLNLEQLITYERDYNCAPGVTDRNQNSIYYFGQQDTVQIEIYGWIRNDAFVLKYGDKYPNAQLMNCLPQEFSRMLSELLFFEHGTEHWMPTFYYTVHDGELKKLRGTKLGEYERRISYYLPGEELWIKRTVYNSR